MLGGDIPSLSVGSRVLVSGKEDATLIGLDPETGYAVITYDTTPTAPTRVALATVTPNNRNLPAPLLSILSQRLDAIIALAESLLSLGNGTSAALLPGIIPTPIQAVCADIKARGVLLLKQVVSSVFASDDVSLQSRIRAGLSPLCASLALSANDIPVAKHLAKPDLSTDASSVLPDTLSELFAQTSELLASIASGPRGVWGVEVTGGKASILSARFPPGGGKVTDLLPQSAFAVGDFVKARAGFDGDTAAVGVIVGPSPDASVTANEVPLVVDPLLAVNVSGRVLSVPQSQLKLFSRPNTKSDAANAITNKSSVYYVAESTVESEGYGAKWELFPSLESGRHRPWGFTAGTLNLLAAKCAKDTLLALIGSSITTSGVVSPWPLEALGKTTEDVCSTITALFSVCDGSSIGARDAAETLQEVLVASFTASANPVTSVKSVLALTASQLTVNAKLAAYDMLVHPPSAEKVYESKHDYENNTHEEIKVSVKGALEMSISFDPMSRTEAGAVVCSAVCQSCVMSAQLLVLLKFWTTFVVPSYSVCFRL